MKSLFTGLANYFSRPSDANASRRFLHAETWPAAVYAIGDIHGCLDELLALELVITLNAEAIPGEKLLVYLGDYIDRGPSSAGVIDHLLSAPLPGFTRVCLAGNHETMMLDYLYGSTGNSHWLEFGGLETLQSYGINPAGIARSSRKGRQTVFHSHIPREHVSFLRDCALALSLPGAIFVHAGLRPGIELHQQSEEDLLWIRDDFLLAEWPDNQVIVHGHTPSPEPQIVPGRIGIDTGAFATGRLSAVRLMQGGPPFLLSAVR
jgi:serine/threonine protein phosphatase 1